MHRWPLQDAKNRFSRLIEDCLQHGPQIVTKRGQETVVVISMEEYKSLTRPSGNLLDFFKNSPLKDVALDLERTKDAPREVEL